MRSNRRALALGLRLAAVTGLIFSVSQAFGAPGDSSEYTRCVNENLVSVARELGFDSSKKATRSERKAVGKAVARKCQHLNRSVKSTPKCKKACRVCSASTAQLKKEFGRSEVPKRFLWAMKYVDGEGYKAYQLCLRAAVRERTTTKKLDCNKKALQACAQACARGLR